MRWKNWKGRKDRAKKNAQINGRTVLVQQRTIQRRLKEMGLMARTPAKTRASKAAAKN